MTPRLYQFLHPGWLTETKDAAASGSNMTNQRFEQPRASVSFGGQVSGRLRPWRANYKRRGTTNGDTHRSALDQLQLRISRFRRVERFDALSYETLAHPEHSFRT